MGKHKYEEDSGKKTARRIEGISVAIVMFGAMMMLISALIPRWRIDPVGTQPLETYWYAPGFKTRGYGLMQITGTYTQTWSIFAQAACEFRDYAGVASFFQHIGSAMGLAKGCANDEGCSKGFVENMNTRCEEYRKISHVSYIGLALTLIGAILCMIGGMVASLSSRKKTGGISFGLWMVAGTFGLITNVMWSIMTHVSFTRIREGAWYPYPSLGVMWYLNLWSIMMVFTGGGVYGWYVLPRVYSHDPHHKKLLKKRDQALKARAKAMAAAGYAYQQGGYQQDGYQQGGYQQGGYQQGYYPQSGYPQGYPPATAYGQTQAYGYQQQDALPQMPPLRPLGFGGDSGQQAPSSGMSGAPQMTVGGGAPQALGFSGGGAVAPCEYDQGFLKDRGSARNMPPMPGPRF